MSVTQHISVDYDKDYIATNENGEVTALYIPNLQYTAIGKFIIFRLKEDRDVKILITGKGKTTGTGKTTLAIILARFVNWVRNELFNMQCEWSAEQYSFMDVWEYLESYKDAKSGDPLITDELEYMADRRSHQTNQNKKFSQAWSVLRWKNVVTIGTAPGLMDIEKRIPEGADIWINVVRKGKANVYYLTMHDFTMERIVRRFRNNGFKESLIWGELVNDKDYQWLKEKKESIGVPGIDDYKEEQLEESDLNQAVRDVRDENVRNITMKLKELEMLDRFTQTQIGEMVGVSQSKVSEIHIEMEREGVI